MRDLEKTRWGILGTGTIAAKFALGLRAADNAELVAVGSRSRETATASGSPGRANGGVGGQSWRGGLLMPGSLIGVAPL